MQKTLIIKLSIIAGLCLIFTIGLVMFSSVISERQSYADSVIREIAKQNVNPQEVITPFIVVPTTVTPICSTKELVKNNKCPAPYTKLKTLLAHQTTTNQKFSVSTDNLKIGVYHVTSYNGDVNFKQTYQVSDLQQDMVMIGKAEQVTHWQQARLVIPVSDLRGVATLPTVTIDQKRIKATYPKVPMLKGLSYVEATLPQSLLIQLAKQTQLQKDATTLQNVASTIALNNNNIATDSSNRPDTSSNASSASTIAKTTPPVNIDINIDLPLTGISSFSTVPTGNNFEMSMSSNWHAPNFVIGAALPNNKAITDNGFDAKWQNQYLTVANNQRLEQCLTVANGQCRITSKAPLNAPSRHSNVNSENEIYEAGVEGGAHLSRVDLNNFGVSFAEPNDVYLQTERTMKYALLLILVSFGTFFLFEIIKASRIHPIQYLLVGSALLVFYVLLLPLAEQIVFWKAYAIAASACVGLIGWYSYYVLGNVKRAVIFTAILSGLYAAFYGILTTEDLNLLLGAVFCFVLLASVMIMTRKIDWYKVA